MFNKISRFQQVVCCAPKLGREGHRLWPKVLLTCLSWRGQSAKCVELGLLPVLKNNLLLGSQCIFIWDAVGCTRWMESAWCCSFSWTPSRLGAD
jgi:hypothetical protein